ncbi:hypothetical protein [Pseudarthrobacter sp. S9]|uniref:hypothetical protein n=1 Tax=Pseudarthrobacter sp. S9 TaxID=3418421 RepID=UPI003CFE4FE0
MTGTRDPQQDGSIQAMLRDSGLEAATELRASLEQLRALVPDQAPAPRADLAALLATGTVGSAAANPSPGAPSVGGVPEGSLPAGVASLADRRRGRNRRLAIVGGAVIGAMSLGAGAVAASSEDFRHNVSRTVGVIFQPSGHGPSPAPEQARPSPASDPAVPASPAPTATTPVGTTPTPATRVPGSRSAQTPSAPHATPPAVGGGGVVPTPGHRPVMPGMPAAPDLPDLGDAHGGSLPYSPAPVSPTLPGSLPSKFPGQS